MSKQLKKNDFLQAVPETAVTKEGMIEILTNDGFEFIPSYVDYLVDHFAAQKRVILNEDGTFQRKPAGRQVSAKEAYRVVENEGDFILETLEITGVLNDEQKEAGWSYTKGAAVKKASSEIFASYKERTAAVKELLVEDSE